MREKNHSEVIHLLPDADYSWYTWTIYQSASVAFELNRIKPRERIQEAYPLTGIATGILGYTVLKRENMTNYEYKLVTKLFVNDIHHIIVAESHWTPFPDKFLKDYDAW